MQWSIRNYSTQAGSECRLIQIEAPGVEEIKVKANNRLAKAHWAIEVSGAKHKNDGVAHLARYDRLAGNARLLPAYNSVTKPEPDSDSCRYGKFSEVFQIPLKFKKPHWIKIGPSNGIFQLVFEEEEELSSSGSEEA